MIATDSLPISRCQVYCDMTAGGGWMRVVDIDPNRTRSCPGFGLISVGSHQLCTRDTASLCYSAEFGVNGKQYTEVRGYAYGFQVGIEWTIIIRTSIDVSAVRIRYS